MPSCPHPTPFGPPVRSAWATAPPSPSSPPRAAASALGPEPAQRDASLYGQPRRRRRLRRRTRSRRGGGARPAALAQGPRDRHPRGRPPGGGDLRAACFPGAPVVSWKGSLGHTLGSCGLVELAVALDGRCAPAGPRDGRQRRRPASPTRSPPNLLPRALTTEWCSPATPSAAPTRRCCSPMIERHIHSVRDRGSRPRGARRDPRAAARRSFRRAPRAA